MTAARRLGYRLVGPRLDYLLHTRPAEWPIMAAHTAVGYLLAVGLRGAAAGRAAAPALLGLALWVVCLNGGTLALNSAFDQDEGDIAYLRVPPRPPAHLAAFGMGLMLAGLAGAALLPAAYLAVYATCLAMSVLYSVPPVRLKAVPGADWLINMWGFGTLTPLAGWVATGHPLDVVHALVILAFCPLFAALYPLTQIYQMDEDARRGDQTFARRLGLGGSLRVSVAAAALAFAVFGLAAAGPGAAQALTPARWLYLAVAAGAWGAVLVPWYVARSRLGPGEHQRGMYRALAAWAVTDVAVVLAWAG